MAEPAPPPGPKIRVVGKIRPVVGTEANRISVKEVAGGGGGVELTFPDQPKSKDTYQLDQCYEPNEETDNLTIYSREVKPLVSSVLAGQSASVFAIGARASGKTFTIQGSDKKPGLAYLAMQDILPMAEEAGISVSVSLYDVHQEHVWDVLDKDRTVVSVLENGQGKIELKGLSQTPVKSISQFVKLYTFDTEGANRKIASQRSHRGLMVHLYSGDGKENHKPISKMNFINLAAYQDPRRKSINTHTASENSRTNKCFYALQSVVYALNFKGVRVPYRDCRLTYMLRDSLGGTNKILIVTCLNPAICLETIFMVSLASRCRKGSSTVFMESWRQAKATEQSLLRSSSKSVMRSASKVLEKPQSVTSGVRKNITSSRSLLSEKKTNKSTAARAVTGRKLFYTISDQPSVMENVCTLEDIVQEKVPEVQEKESVEELLSSSGPSKDASENCSEVVNSSKALTLFDEGCETGEHTSVDNEHASSSQGGCPASTDKETQNKNSVDNDPASPPLSAKMEELSNYLKSFSTSSKIHVQQEGGSIKPNADVTCLSVIVSQDAADVSSHCLTSSMPSEPLEQKDTSYLTNLVEPATPVAKKQSFVNHDAIVSSPWIELSAQSAGVKKCLTQECVRFINSASKEDLKRLKGIGEKRASYILQLRQKSPEHFKDINDLQKVGLSGKQINALVGNIAGGGLFN